MPCKLKFTTCLRLFIVLLVSVASCAFFLWFAYSGSLIWFLDWVASIGLWGNLLFIGCLALTGLPFALGGYTPLGLAAGFIYGVLNACVTVMIGTMLGSTLGFWITRLMMKSWFKALVDSRPALQAFMKTMESHGFKLVLVMRMAPIPFGVQNGLFSISDITFVSFTTATLLGLLPEVVMLVYMGTTMRDLAEIASGDFHFGPWQQAMLGIEIGVSIILGIILVWLSRQAMNQVKKNQAALLNAEGDDSSEGLLDEYNYSIQSDDGLGGEGPDEIELGLTKTSKKKKKTRSIAGEGSNSGSGGGIEIDSEHEGVLVVLGDYVTKGASASSADQNKKGKGGTRVKNKKVWD